jgi:tRNA(fMet)-specific endonuclease VapC
LLALFAVLSLDYESGRLWGELAEALKSGGIGDRDLFVASIALVNRQTIITGNRKHFERVPGLLVEGW